MVQNYWLNQIVKRALLHILWLLLTSSIIVYASPLDSITYGPDYTLKISQIWKNDFFNPTFFSERKALQCHAMVILIALDELYKISLLYAICLKLSTFLVQKKTRFLTPYISDTFSGQCEVILVYSGRSRSDIQESYPMSYFISYTHNVAHL